MDERTLVADVKQRLGGASEEEVARAIVATLNAIGECMKRADAEKVAAPLPPALANEVLQMPHRPGLGLGAFYEHVADRATMSIGHAREAAQSVCTSLYDQLPERARAELSRLLWPELIRPTLADRMAPTVPRGAWHLFDARPGSRHPVSESPPPLRAQSGSVVVSDNPHGDRKISSHGLS